MSNNSLSKKELRTIFLEKRNKMILSDVKSYSKSISKQVIESTEYKEAELVLCYYPLANEVDILAVAKEGLIDGKVIAFPKVYSKEQMEFHRILSLDDFEEGRFSVMEPTTSEVLHISKKALMLVPGLIYDQNNYRLGYGGGYYDRYINSLQDNAGLLTTIGCFFSWQTYSSLPIEEYDKKLDRIIVEQY